MALFLAAHEKKSNNSQVKCDNLIFIYARSPFYAYFFSRELGRTASTPHSPALDCEQTRFQRDWLNSARPSKKVKLLLVYTGPF